MQQQQASWQLTRQFQVFKEYIMQCKKLWDEMGDESAVHDKMLYDVHEEAGTNQQVVKDLTTEFRDDFGIPVKAGQVAALEAENHNFAATVMVPSKTGTDSRPATGVGFDRRKMNEGNLAARIGDCNSHALAADCWVQGACKVRLSQATVGKLTLQTI